MKFAQHLLAGAAYALCLPAITYASVVSDTETGAEQDRDVIMVTARRREEALRDIPVAVGVIDAETILRQQIYSVREIAAYTPGVNINSDSVSRAFVSIRGVGTTLIDTVQPGVGIFIDGIYQPNTSYLNSPLVDVERVEVLRGPQGTLFGNNTLGGAINVITRQPGDEFSVRANAVYADPDDFRSISGSISGPIVEGVLRGRIGAAHHSRDGFQVNALAGGNMNPLTQNTVNGTLVLEPSPWARFTLNASRDEVEGGNTPYLRVSGPTDHTFEGQTNQNNITNIKYTGINLSGDFDLDQINTTLTVVGAFDRRELSASGDGDFSPVDFLRTRGENTLETRTGEVRFDTLWSDRVSTLVGVFASRSTVDSSTFTTLVPLALTIPGGSSSVSEFRAIFGTVFIAVSDDVDVSLGIRYDEQDLNSTTAGGPAYSASEWQPRLTITRRWSEQFMTYASLARGVRGGGQNGPGAPNLIYEGDSVWTYELGARFASADRRFTLDTAIFYNDYDNFIGQNSLAPSTAGAGFVAINLNTGDVRSYGIEAEANWQVSDQFRLSGAITLLNARITDDTPYQNTTGQPTSTDRIIFTPDWNFHVAANYIVPLGENDLSFDASLVGKGSRIGSSLDPAVAPEMDAYYLTNASVAYRTGNVEIALFATNLFEERYLESYIDASALSRAGLPAPIPHNIAVPGDGRRVGVRLSLRY